MSDSELSLGPPCRMTLDELWDWCARSPYFMLFNARYREGFAIVHDDPARPVVAEGESARRFPAMVQAAREAALR